jgi:hypothetical protein
VDLKSQKKCLVQLHIVHHPYDIYDPHVR